MKYFHEYKKALDEKLVKKASAYWKELERRTSETAYISPLDFLALPHDKKQVAYLEDSLEDLRKSLLRHVFVIGIGGSCLGAKAIEKAFARDITSSNRADIIFIEDCDERFLQILETLISLIESPEEFAIVYISKSGTTLETAANADAFFAIMGERFGNVFNRTVVVSDYGSILYRLGEELGARVVAMPKSIGGRFSVFSPAGLVPLYLAGFDIEELLAGAREAFSMKTSGMPTALLSAVYAYHEADKGKAVRDLFLFRPELEDLGKWWRQLVGESLGKQSRDGEDRGVIPTVSIGSHDLHSMAQRYFGGLDNFFTTLIRVEDKNEVYSTGFFTERLSRVGAHPVGRIEEVLYKACRETYSSLGVSFDECVFDSISLRELGTFMQFKMIETAILGHLADINAFDQPDVEGYKKITKSILSE